MNVVTNTFNINDSVGLELIAMYNLEFLGGTLMRIVVCYLCIGKYLDYCFVPLNTKGTEIVRRRPLQRMGTYG